MRGHWCWLAAAVADSPDGAVIMFGGFGDAGVAENLTRAMAPFGVAYEDIPSPLNLFQNMEIDPRTGAMTRTRIRPEAPLDIEFRAEMDLIIAFSACPDLASPTGGREVKATILAP